MSQLDEYGRELIAKQIERRKFLKGVLGISGLALASGSGLARALMPKATAAALPSGLDNFTTIVVGMMENRSFDHYLGWIGPDLGGVQEGFSNPTSLEPPPDGCSSVDQLAVDDATPVAAFHLDQHCAGVPDPDHGWDGGRVELNHGALNGFVERSGPVAVGYFKPEDIPFTAWLVRNYTTFSNYFCSVLGPTYPNRRYLHSAQGGGFRGNNIPTPTPDAPLPTGHPWPTIWDRLTDAGVDWAFYGSDLPTIALFFSDVWNPRNLGKVRHIVDFYIDAALGILPRVVFIDPSFVIYGNDDHPARDIKFGQRFIQDAFLAVAEGPQWYDAKTGKGAAFVMTYDEWGGFYDHVAPPTAPDILANADHCEDWGQLGFRVPTMFASPFSKQNLVGTEVYDHTSILKMIEWNFNLAPLTPRDAAARNLAEVLDFNPANARPDFADPATGTGPPPFIPLHLASLWCAQSQTIEYTEGENPLEAIPDIPLPAPAIPGNPLPATGSVLPPVATLAKSPDQFGEPHPEMLALADAGFFGKLDFRERAKSGVWRQ